MPPAVPALALFLGPGPFYNRLFPASRRSACLYRRWPLRFGLTRSFNLMASAPDFLAKVILFQDLDADALSDLGTLLTPKRLSAGSIIFRELDASDALYIVEQGSVVVSKHVRDDVDIVLTRFRSGDFFGEMGLFDAGPRSATAQVEIDSKLWQLSRKVFQDVFSLHPEIAEIGR